MIRVLAFGTFDHLHPGHRAFLKQAKAHGNHLTVVVGRDDVVTRLKGRAPDQPLRHRMAAVAAVPGVDAVRPGLPKRYLLHLSRLRPDVVCLGYDQTHFTKNLRDDLDRLGLHKARIVRLRPFRPHRYKSSLRRPGKTLDR